MGGSRLAHMNYFSPLLGAAALAIASSASAQLAGTYRVRAGIGAQVTPDFPGASSDEWSPYWTFSVKKGDEPFPFGAPGDSAGLTLLGNSRYAVGPVARISPGRSNEDVGLPLGRVPRTVEVGGFVQAYPLPSLRLRAELRKGIGGHEGLVGFVGADQIWRDGDRYTFSVGPRLWFGNSRYERAWFGVSPSAALATGLPVYQPGGGFDSAGATAGMQYSLGHDWGLFGYAQYKRLIGGAHRSPIVRQIGSPDQFSAGIGLSHTFTIKL